MRNTIGLWTIALTALLLTAATGLAADDATGLLSNPDMEQTTDDGQSPKDWPTPEGVQWLEEDGNHFLRLHADPDRMLTVYRRVYLDPAKVQACELTFRYRVNDLKRGKENWHDGRLILDFKDAGGKKLKPSPGHPSFKGSTDGWQAKTVEFVVPEKTQYLEIMPAMFKAASGSYDIDDVVLAAVDREPIEEANRKAALERSASKAGRAMRAAPQVPPAPADKLPPELHVDGNQILNADGQAVWLQGVSIPSMGWSAGGENILESVQVAIDDWNANTIRLPLKEHFWYGKGKWQKDGGAAYRQLVEDVVNLAGSQGVYVVIDLHRFRAPKQVHADFWREVALIYRNHPAVMFELFNEPHDVSWNVWKNGGFVHTGKNSDDVVAERKDELEGFESVGMQALVDAVRLAGARNIVIVGGLDWSYDISGILNGYAIDDHGGNGVVYSTHVYPWKNKWQSKFMRTAEQHPIFIGECGASKERMPFIPPEQHEEAETWVPDFLGLVQKHKYHWTAWSFHPRASPCLLVDWEYTPTPYWGVHAKQALHGKRFELTNPR